MPSGLAVPFDEQKKYMVLDRRSAGEELVFTFELPQRTMKTKVGHIDTTITVRGNEVVAFDPPGKYYPFWCYKKVNQDKVPEVLRSYFIPDKKISW